MGILTGPPATLAEHDASFPDAATSFGAPLGVTYPYPDHSEDEGCLLTFGRPGEGHPLIVSHADREGRARIIGARRAMCKKRDIHEEG